MILKNLIKELENAKNNSLLNENHFWIDEHISKKILEQQLEPVGFCRIHHEYLVNMDHVTKYHKGDGGEVELSNGEKLAVSRSRKVFLNKWFEL